MPLPAGVPAPPLPCFTGLIAMSVAGADAAEFEEWVREELGRSPLVSQGFESLLHKAGDVMVRIRATLIAQDHKAVWQRLMKGGRMLKEVNEVLPMVARLLDWLQARPSRSSSRAGADGADGSGGDENGSTNAKVTVTDISLSPSLFALN